MTLRRFPPPRAAEDPTQQIYSRRLGRAYLFLDDVDDIIQLLHDRCATVTIGALHAVAETPEDLRDATSKELSQITISTTGPAVSVELGFARSRATAALDTTEGRSIVDDVHGLVNQRTSWYAGVLPAWGLLAVMVAVATIPLVGHVDSTFWPALAVVTLMIVMFGFVIWRENVSVIVVPERRSERRIRSSQYVNRFVGFMAGSAVTIAGAIIQARLSK